MHLAKSIPVAITLSAAFLFAITAPAKALTVSSSVIHDGATIAKQYTGDGADVSPPLAWSAAPAAAKSIAITVEDPDAPNGTWFHWIIFNLPPKMQQLGQGVPKSAEIAGGIHQGTNDFGRIGYNGPLPPPGQTHRYQFKVMALSKMLPLKGGCSKAEFEAAIRSCIVSEGKVTGKYSR